MTDKKRAIETFLTAMGGISPRHLEECDAVRSGSASVREPSRLSRILEPLGYGAAIAAVLAILIVVPALLRTKPVVNPADTTAPYGTEETEATDTADMTEPVETIAKDFEVLSNDGGMTVETAELPVPEGHSVYAFSYSDRYGGYAVGACDGDGYCADGVVLYLLDRETGCFVHRINLGETYFPRQFHVTEDGGILYGMDEDDYHEYSFRLTKENGIFSVVSVEHERYPYVTKRFTSSDGRYTVYEAEHEMDAYGSGGLTIGHYDENGDPITLFSSKEVYQPDGYSYRLYGFLDGSRFAYDIAPAGYGIYDLATGEKMEHGAGLIYGVQEGVIYCAIPVEGGSLDSDGIPYRYCAVTADGTQTVLATYGIEEGYPVLPYDANTYALQNYLMVGDAEVVTLYTLDMKKQLSMKLQGYDAYNNLHLYGKTVTLVSYVEPPTVCEHDYHLTATVEPSCEEVGGRTYTCARCGESYLEELAPLYHEYENQTCIRCGMTYACEGFVLKPIDGGTAYRVVGLRDGCKDDEERVTFPSSFNGLPVTEIGGGLFDDDTARIVVIPDSVVRFDGTLVLHTVCYVEEIHIGSGLKYVDPLTFVNGSSNIKKFVVSKSNETFKSVDGHLYSKDGTVFIRYAPNNKAASFTVPDGVNRIENRAFVGAAYLKNITLPSGVTTIGDVAFYACEALREIHLPDGVTSVGHSAFERNYELRTIRLPESLVSLGDKVFNDCKKLTELHIPAALINFYPATFSKCISVTAYTVDESNPLLKAVDGNLYSKDGTVLIQYALGKKENSFTVPDGVTTIGKSSFQNAVNVKEVVLPEGVKKIEAMAFAYRTELTTVVLPESLEEIEDEAFYYCNQLVNIRIPDGVKAIGSLAFAECHELPEIHVPQGAVLGNYAFKNCRSLTSVDLRGISPVLPQGLFAGCSRLKTVLLPEGVTEMPGELFYQCALTEFVIPEGVTSIGIRTFAQCGELLQIRLPSTLEIIDNYAFWECRKLKEITIPNGVKIIGESAFCDCNSLVEIVVPDGVTEIGEGAFRQWNGNNSLSRVVLPAGLTRLEGSLLGGCHGLTELVIPDGVTYIGWGAFYKCTGLTELTLPQGVEVIESAAFWDCSGLTSMVIPEGVTLMGEHAFTGCTNLTDIYCEAKQRPTNWNDDILGSCPATVHFGWKEEAPVTDPETTEAPVTDPVTTEAPATAETQETDDPKADAENDMTWLYIVIAVAVVAVVVIVIVVAKKKK